MDGACRQIASSSFPSMTGGSSARRGSKGSVVLVPKAARGHRNAIRASTIFHIVCSALLARRSLMNILPEERPALKSGYGSPNDVFRQGSLEIKRMTERQK
jgi:hypothetical protein